MGKIILPIHIIMNIKSLKYITIGLVLAVGVPVLTGCSKTPINEQKQEVVNYTKVEIGEVPFEVIDEYGSENKYIRQWIVENKETEGLYTKMFEGNTYVLYSMGEKTHYGYGINNVSAFKEANDNPIAINLVSLEPNLDFAKEEVNYPYIALKFKGNIKDTFKEELEILTQNIEEVTEEVVEETENNQDNEIIEGDVNETE